MFKAALLSLLHVVAAVAVYAYLVSGGWLTNRYQLSDPNSVNLVLAIFEPLALVSVPAYWLGRTPFLYRLMFALAVIQVLIGAGFLAFILVFMLTWKPRMM